MPKKKDKGWSCGTGDRKARIDGSEMVIFRNGRRDGIESASDRPSYSPQVSLQASLSERKGVAMQDGPCSWTPLVVRHDAGNCLTMATAETSFRLV